MRIADIKYDITIQAGSDYAIDFSYEEDDGTVIPVTGWGVEAHLREFPESNDNHVFAGTADAYGFHVTMDHTETSKISYTLGAYDVFIIPPCGGREKLIYGKAHIIPEVAR